MSQKLNEILKALAKESCIGVVFRILGAHITELLPIVQRMKNIRGIAAKPNHITKRDLAKKLIKKTNK